MSTEQWAQPPFSLERVVNRSERVGQQRGVGVGEELRHQAEALAYRAAFDYVAYLRHVEASLVAAASDGSQDEDVVLAVEITRTYMIRGLLRANVEIGDHLTFWVPRR